MHVQKSIIGVFERMKVNLDAEKAKAAPAKAAST
jgi:hypothetical protein